jgi:hypothetical protein
MVEGLSQYQGYKGTRNGDSSGANEMGIVENME